MAISRFPGSIKWDLSIDRDTYYFRRPLYPCKSLIMYQYFVKPWLDVSLFVSNKHWLHTAACAECRCQQTRHSAVDVVYLVVCLPNLVLCPPHRELSLNSIAKFYHFEPPAWPSYPIPSFNNFGIAQFSAPRRIRIFFYAPNS